MSVKVQQSSQIDSDLQSIMDQIQNIDEQQKNRQFIYTQCLNDFKNHLNFEINQLSSKQKQFQKKNNHIKESYQNLYESVHENIDVSLRSIKRTYDSKKAFWKQIIKQNTDSPNLQEKKTLYYLKGDIQQKIYEIIDQRNLFKKAPFEILISTEQKGVNKLEKYQNNVKILERNVYSGMNTLQKWQALQSYDQNMDNKENTSRNNSASRALVDHKGVEELQINNVLNKFSKKK